MDNKDYEELEIIRYQQEAEKEKALKQVENEIAEEVHQDKKDTEQEIKDRVQQEKERIQAQLDRTQSDTQKRELLQKLQGLDNAMQDELDS